MDASVFSKPSSIVEPAVTSFDESQQRRVEAEAEALSVEKRNKVSAASGQLVTAALSLAGELFSSSDAPEPSPETVNNLASKLAECVDRDSEGRPQLKISLASDDSLKDLATTLAKLLGQ